MFKTPILFLFLLFSTPLLWAQAASNFDGVDDKATVYHHTDFNLSTKDFTIEAIVRDVVLDKAMLTVISKRDLFDNGFALMINTSDGMKVIAEVGKDKYEVNTSVFEDRGCHSIGLRRSRDEITLFIDDKAYSLGSNNRNINTTENLIIGDDGSNTHNPFDGYIEEVRFWDIARSNNQIFDWNHKCIAPSTSGLLALWNIEENAGQFFHDVASIKHHAYLGSGFSNDNQDPLWTSNECLETCCNASAGFTVSDYTPLAAQWVHFTNTSSNTNSYEWSIDNQVVGTNQHLQYSFGMGVFIVRLKVASQSGCASYYSEVIEVTDDNFSYCGEENFTSAGVHALEDWENLDPNPNPYPQIRMYDRFGNRYLPNDVTIPSQQIRSSGTTNWSCSCGIFELYFDDMFHNRDYGFDDPILGADRRAVACRVFEDLSALVNPSGTLSSNLVKIQFKKSDGKAPLEASAIDEIDPGVLAVAGPHIISTYNTGTIDGLVYKTIVSGTNAIANTPGWNPNSYHGSVRVDFDLPNFFLNNTNWTSIVPNNQTDLYSTLLHESLHLLGFYSLINANTNLSKLNGSQLYNRFDTYLENAAGTPYIDPSTGILNPASTFIGGANCSADVLFNGSSNSNQTVYLPSPWNFSTISHFNCTANNNLGCAVNNGYIMNACLSAGEMQRAPNQAEYSTLCDIGYQLSTTYGNSAAGAPANNVPYQTYTSCTPPCPVAGIDDDLTSTVLVAPGGTVSINANDFLANDNNIGGSYNFTTLLSSFGTISNITATGFDFTVDPNFWGTAIIQYHPTCANGNNGSSALIFIQVTAPPFPSCDLPPSSCNLLCFGDFENIVGDYNGHAVGTLDEFITTYNNTGSIPYGSGSSINHILTTELIHFNTITQQPNWPNSSVGRGLNELLYGCTGLFAGNPSLPLPVNFPTKSSYIGMLSLAGALQNYDQIYLPLTAPLDISPSDNYRLTFWAFTPCTDVHLRMILSDAPPCINGVNNLSDPINPSSFPASLGCMSPFFNYLPSNCPTYTAALNTGIVVNNPPDISGAYSWKQYTLDFHVNTPNVQHVIFHPAFGSGFNPPGTPTSCMWKYILLDEMSIEKIASQPQLTITPSITGVPCPGNKVIIEYDICSDLPVSNIDLDVQLPSGSGLLYTNAFNFTNGQITGLDLGTGGSSLCTLVRVEIEIPLGANTPSTQSIVMDVTGGTTCTSTASSLTTDLNIGTGSPLAISVTSSLTGNVNIGNNFTADITISNTGTIDVQNVVVELPSLPQSVGLNYGLNSTTIPNIPAGGQHTISAVPISVSGPCGNAQVCAEVVSADGACNLPSECSSLLTVLGTSTTSFPVEVENTAHTDATVFTATAIGNNDEIYSVGIFSNDIDFTEGTSTNTLVKSHTCSSLFSPFLVKYSSCGFEWAVEIPVCNLVDLRTVPDVEIGQNGDIYVAFSFLGSFTINGTTYTSQGDADIAIIKYDPTGTPIWVKTEGGIGEDWVTDIETYYNGNNEEIFIVGTLFGSAPNTVSFSTNPITIVNYNNNGLFCSGCFNSGGGISGGVTYLATYIDNGMSATTNWIKSLNNTATFSGKLSLDLLGNAYIVGYTNSSFIFNTLNVGNLTTSLNDGSPSSSGADIDLFVLKYNNSGAEIWAEVYGSDKIDIGYLEASDFEFDIECEGSTHLGVLLPSSALPSATGTQQPYMQNFGTHLLRLNASNGSLTWVQPIATPSNSSNSNINGNMTYHSHLTINGTDYLVNGSFLLVNPTAAATSGFASIDFHGTTINYTSMSAYPTYDDYQGTFAISFDFSGNVQWVNTNTSILPLTPPVDIHSTLVNLDIETDNSGNIYSPFYLRGTTTLNTNNLTGGITGNQDVVDGFISKIDGTTGNYLRPDVNSSNTQGQNDLTTIGINNQTLETPTITTTSNISTKLYPNPTTGKVTLEIKSNMENNKVEQIIIYDVIGRKIQEISIEEQQKLFDINLDSQQSGVYFVEMMINKELITKRVVLMK